ncbi:hypothetical protein [Streptomyces nodosus]|uniref:hypothetical protein n=1 Tax=Streptomyces nodosus TaxID=40318 RepID=UPI0036F1208D
MLPDKLCGVHVDLDELVEFLPPGKKLTAKEEFIGRDKLSEQCDLFVDGELIVRTSREWSSEDKSTTWHGTSMTPSKLDHQSDGGRFVYSGHEAFGKTKICRRAIGADKYAMFTGAQVFGSKHRDAKAMKSVITRLTEAVEKSSVCGPKGEQDG